VRQFYEFYQSSIVQQAVGQLQPSIIQNEETIQHPVVQIQWGHNILIFSKSNSIEEAYFYILETIGNNWSRDLLAFQMKSQLSKRQDKASKRKKAAFLGCLFKLKYVISI
jgi:predicted nuclease of restriction endonuclease-like (RecB) superfamily